MTGVQTCALRSDNRQLETKYSTQGSFTRAEKELLAGSECRTNAPAKWQDNAQPGTAGNALLTALAKGRSESDSSRTIRKSETFREQKEEQGEKEPCVSKNLSPMVASTDSKTKGQLELNPSREKAVAAKAQGLEHKVVLPQPSSAASSTRVRLIALSQSNLATAHRDGAINVIRQLSDRSACSSIRVVVKPIGSTIQLEPKAGRKAAGPDSGKSSQPQPAGNRPEVRIENRSAKVEQKPNPIAGHKLDGKPEIKPEIKLDGKPEVTTEAKPSSFDNTPKRRAPGPSERNAPAAAQEPLVDSQAKVLRGYRLKCQDADLKYLTGPEIALSAIIALASIAKLRTDQSMWQTDNAALLQPFAVSNYITEVVLDSGLPSAISKFAVGPDLTGSTRENAHDRTPDNNNDISETSQSVFIRPKILISTHDSLVSIAEQLFNDAGIAWLILRLNEELKPVIMEGKTVVRLRSRQEIVIPVYQDIIDFQKTRTKEMCGSNLITVVEETQIDREIVDMAIAPMLGHKSQNIDPLQSEQLPQALHYLQIVNDEP